jgi:hypothetical protein
MSDRSEDLADVVGKVARRIPIGQKPVPEAPPFRDIYADSRAKVDAMFDGEPDEEDEEGEGASDEETPEERPPAPAAIAVPQTPVELDSDHGHPIDTACPVCSKHHLAFCAGAFKEGMRFARSDGIESPEVQTRIEHCTEELAIMEREDGDPAKLVELPPAEKALMDEMLPKARDFRHMMDSMESVQDYEATTAFISNLSTDFRQKLFEAKRAAIHQRVDQILDGGITNGSGSEAEEGETKAESED